MQLTIEKGKPFLFPVYPPPPPPSVHTFFLSLFLSFFFSLDSTAWQWSHFIHPPRQGWEMLLEYFTSNSPNKRKTNIFMADVKRHGSRRTKEDSMTYFMTIYFIWLRTEMPAVLYFVLFFDVQDISECMLTLVREQKLNMWHIQHRCMTHKKYICQW